MANRYFYRTLNTLHPVATLIDCNFIIDSTNGNGLGVRSLKGPGVASVIGYSTVPAASNNMSAGNFMIRFQDTYFRYFGGFSGFVAPNSGTTNVTAGLTKGKAYVIASVGTTTTAQWQFLGLQVGILPAVGVAFVASTASVGTGSGIVIAPSTSGVLSVEVLGDPNTTIVSTSPPPFGAIAGNPGGYVIVQTMGLPPSGQTPILTQPADGSVFGLSFYLSNSSVLVAGE